MALSLVLNGFCAVRGPVAYKGVELQHVHAEGDHRPSGLVCNNFFWKPKTF